MIKSRFLGWLVGEIKEGFANATRARCFEEQDAEPSQIVIYGLETLKEEHSPVFEQIICALLKTDDIIVTCNADKGTITIDAASLSFYDFGIIRNQFEPLKSELKSYGIATRNLKAERRTPGVASVNFGNESVVLPFQTAEGHMADLATGNVGKSSLSRGGKISGSQIAARIIADGEKASLSAG